MEMTAWRVRRHSVSNHQAMKFHLLFLLLCVISPYLLLLLWFCRVLFVILRLLFMIAVPEMRKSLKGQSCPLYLHSSNLLFILALHSPPFHIIIFVLCRFSFVFLFLQIQFCPYTLLWLSVRKFFFSSKSLSLPLLSLSFTPRIK